MDRAPAEVIAAIRDEWRRIYRPSRVALGCANLCRATGLVDPEHLTTDQAGSYLAAMRRKAPWDGQENTW